MTINITFEGGDEISRALARQIDDPHGLAITVNGVAPDPVLRALAWRLEGGVGLRFPINGARRSQDGGGLTLVYGPGELALAVNDDGLVARAPDGQDAD